MTDLRALIEAAIDTMTADLRSLIDSVMEEEGCEGSCFILPGEICFCRVKALAALRAKMEKKQ